MHPASLTRRQHPLLQHRILCALRVRNGFNQRKAVDAPFNGIKRIDFGRTVRLSEDGDMGYKTILIIAFDTRLNS
ncbi:MAG: hypothetical protein WBO14_09860 [Gammaproteobacteria bacterium]